MGFLSQTRQIASGSILLQLVSLFIFVLLTRQLGAFDYGIYASVLALATTVFNFSAQWLTPYLISNSAKYFDERGTIGPHFFYPFILANLLVLSGVVLAYLFSQVKVGDELQGWFPIFLLMFSFGMLWLTLVRSLFQSLQKYQTYALLLWLDKGILLLALCVLYLSNNLTIFYVLFVAGAALMTSGLYSWVLLRQNSLSRDGSQYTHRRFAKDSYPVFLSVVTLYFSSPAFTIVLAGYFYGAQAAGYVGVAFVIYGFLLFPLRWIVPTLLPRFSIDLNKGDDRMINRFVDHYLFIFLLLYAAGMILFLPIINMTPMLTLVIGEEYAPALPVVVLVTSAVVADIIVSLATQVFYSREQNRIVLFSMLIKSVLFLVGAATSSDIYMLSFFYALSTWVSALFCIYQLKKKVDIALLLRFAVVFVLSALPYWFMSNGGDYYFIFVLAVLMVSCMFYILLLIRRAAHPGTLSDFIANIKGK